MVSNLVAMASNLVAMASNLVAMASNLSPTGVVIHEGKADSLLGSPSYSQRIQRTGRHKSQSSQPVQLMLAPRHPVRPPNRDGFDDWSPIGHGPALFRPNSAFDRSSFFERPTFLRASSAPEAL